MSRRVVPERELTSIDKELRDRLLTSFRRRARIVTHCVYEMDEFRECVAVIKQEMDDRKLLVIGCRLGAPPEHEATASSFGTYEQVLAKLESGNRTDAEKKAIRAFIKADDEAAAEAALPRRRRGKRRRD